MGSGFGVLSLVFGYVFCVHRVKGFKGVELRVQGPETRA
jgi:hypothetical protein